MIRTNVSISHLNKLPAGDKKEYQEQIQTLSKYGLMKERLLQSLTAWLFYEY